MRVLVTRPEPGAGQTATELRKRGFQPVLLPLSRTVPLDGNRPHLDSARAAAYAVTSAAAVRHWSVRPISRGHLDRPVYAVGEATAASARAAGFAHVKTGSGDGAELAALIAADVASDALSPASSEPLVYVAGRHRTPHFEAALAARQVPFMTTEIYDIQEISYSTDFQVSQIVTNEETAVLFYSHTAARLFFDGFGSHISPESRQKWHFLCLSDQVAAAVPDAFLSQTASAFAPRESALLSLLEGLRSAA